MGCQLLGTSKLDRAATHLQSARLNPTNTQAATTLITLLEKLRKPDNDSQSSAEQQGKTSADRQPQTEEVK